MSGRSNRRRWLSLRLRFALWSGGLLLLGGVFLVLFINLTAPKIPASGGSFVITPIVTAQDGEMTTIGRTALAARPVASPPPPDSSRQLTPLQVRIASFFGLGLLILLGGIGAYWFADRALSPVRAVSQAASRIDHTDLDTRLALDGPDDEVQDLVRAFDAMLDRLQRSFDQQGRFVADAAHELRTPLAILRATLDTASAHSDSDERRRFVAPFERQLTRLERLVGDLLLLAREDAPIGREELTLGVLLEEVVDQLQPLASTRGARLLHATGALEAVVAGDGSLLARVFVNLAENGLQHTPPGGAIRITVARTGSSVSIAVIDTGSGIPYDEREQIFERFYRGDQSRTRNRGGAGLGLSIVADAVRRHGGRITLDSQLGSGSTFTVILPAIAPSEQES